MPGRGSGIEQLSKSSNGSAEFRLLHGLESSPTGTVKFAYALGCWIRWQQSVHVHAKA